MYEIKRVPGAIGEVATVRIRYQNVEAKPEGRWASEQGGRIVEQSQELSTSAIRSSLGEMSPRFKLAASVAQLGELLRHSYRRKGETFDGVLGLAREAARSLRDPDVDELVASIGKAASLAAARRGCDSFLSGSSRGRVRDHEGRWRWRASGRKDGVMSHTIPERIVAAVEELAEALGAWCSEGQDRSLAAHEAAVLERVRAALPRLLEAVVASATSGLHARVAHAPQRCPGCRRRIVPRAGRRPRQVLTQCGLVQLARPYFHCGRCRAGWSVLETTPGPAARARTSAGLDGWLARLGATTDFREAADLLTELTGLAAGAETVRRHTEALGAAVRRAETAAVAQVERTREAAEPVEAAPGVLLVEADGAMVRYLDGWHEVKLGLAGGWRNGTLVEPSYVAAREPAAAWGPRLAAEAARRGALAIRRWEGGPVGRGLAVLREVAVLGDGARWIWDQAAEQFGARVEIVDHYHAAAHLHALGRALLGEGEAAVRWAEARGRDLLARGVAPVLAELRAARAPTATARAALRRERAYFQSNAERMAYPEFRLDGLPIGSGAIESAADHLVQRRLKRAGMRWSEPGADAVLALRARLRSGRPITLVPAA